VRGALALVATRPGRVLDWTRSLCATEQQARLVTQSSAGAKAVAHADASCCLRTHSIEPGREVSADFPVLVGGVRTSWRSDLFRARRSVWEHRLTEDELRVRIGGAAGFAARSRS
jgi:hypothetical protein